MADDLEHGVEIRRGQAGAVNEQSTHLGSAEHPIRVIGAGCLLIDAGLPGMSGVHLLEALRAAGHDLPAIVLTGQSDVTMAIRAVKAGASDFFEKPVDRPSLLASVARGLERSLDAAKVSAWQQDAATQVAVLTQRQRQIMTLVLAGHPSKNIAADFGISQRTVENHRASIMHKMGVTSLPALARLTLAGSAVSAENQPTLAGRA